MEHPNVNMELVPATTVIAEILKLVTEVIGNPASLNIPEQLQPQRELYRIGPAFFSGLDESFDEDVEIIQGDIGRFFETRSNGTYRIGLWGHGINSYAFYLQFRSTTAALFLRLPFGGHFMDNAKCLDSVNSYLTALSGLINECERRQISVEVCESMGYGFYRFFTADEQGIEFEESLVEDSDPRRRFNKMIATFAVEITGRNVMKSFADNEQGYRTWLTDNSDGYVLNSDSTPVASYLILHSASCWTIAIEGVNYTGDMQKTCATDRSILEQWAFDTTGEKPSECGKCLG